MINRIKNEILKYFPIELRNAILLSNDINLDKIILPNSNWSLDDLLLKAKKSTDVNTFGIGYEADIYWAMPYLNYYGGGVLDNNFNEVIGLSESQKGLAFYKDLVSKYKSATNWSTYSSKFRAIEDYSSDGTLNGKIKV